MEDETMVNSFVLELIKVLEWEIQQRGWVQSRVIGCFPGDYRPYYPTGINMKDKEDFILGLRTILSDPHSKGGIMVFSENKLVYVDIHFPELRQTLMYSIANEELGECVDITGKNILAREYVFFDG